MTITIIGELCHDTFVYGEVVRLCPEAPVPVLTNIKTENNFGMAGNVKRNLLSFNSSLQINLIHQKRSIKKTRYYVSIFLGRNNTKTKEQTSLPQHCRGNQNSTLNKCPKL